MADTWKFGHRIKLSYQHIFFSPFYRAYFWLNTFYEYRQVSNISRTLVGNKIVDHSDVVGASPVGAAPITSSFST